MLSKVSSYIYEFREDQRLYENSDDVQYGEVRAGPYNLPQVIDDILLVDYYLNYY